MSAITSHVLDTSLGRPAAGISIRLEQARDGQWAQLGEQLTNDDGRVTGLVPADTALTQGVYRLEFAVKPYFDNLGIDSFYPRVCIEFEIRNPSEHHHVPLLLNPFGYSTYRGS